jgi:hypothetical protein
MAEMRSTPLVVAQSPVGVKGHDAGHPKARCLFLFLILLLLVSQFHVVYSSQCVFPTHNVASFTAEVRNTASPYGANNSIAELREA